MTRKDVFLEARVAYATFQGKQHFAHITLYCDGSWVSTVFPATAGTWRWREDVQLLDLDASWLSAKICKTLSMLYVKKVTQMIVE